MKKNRRLMLGALVILNLLFLIFYGCRPGDIEDNKLYVVEEDDNKKNTEVEDTLDGTKSVNNEIQTEGMDRFIQDDMKPGIYKELYDTLANMNLKKNRMIPLTVPKDGKTIFAMELVSDGLTDIARWRLSSNNEGLIIKGKSERKVNLYKVDLDKKVAKGISPHIDFISSVKWNNEGNQVAFLSGRKLIVYDLDEERLLFEDIERDGVTYFNWSYDGKKIYTEGMNLVNSSIYYIDSEKLVEAYETKENLYYKGKLDENYYFATLQEIDESKLKYGGAPEYRTIIVDKEGNMIKELVGGRFRDAYKRSILQAGLSAFGLYYYPDIERMEDVKILTEEYVYDAKFVEDGKIAYIVEDKENIEGNGFLLHIVDKEGNEINKYDISSSKIFVTPEGGTGILSADYYHDMNFNNHKMSDIKLQKNNPEELIDTSEKELREVFKTIRGAMDIYLKLQINTEADYKALEKYFINIPELEQAAALDMELMFKDTKEDKARSSISYSITLSLDKIYIDDSQNKAWARVKASVHNSEGSGMGQGLPLELIKKDDRWYVMGISTFPNSKKAKEVRKLAAKYIEDIKKGTLYDGKLKGKDIEIVQIQFWTMSEPHLSDNIDYANYSKVYIKVKENEKQTIYKMILNNKDYRDWKPKIITNERLGRFF